jgi:hypothetical protein
MSSSKSNEGSSSSDQEMVDIVDEPSYQASLQNASMKSVSNKKRGPKKIPPQWSRVIDADFDYSDGNVGYNIETDK